MNLNYEDGITTATTIIHILILIILHYTVCNTHEHLKVSNEVQDIDRITFFHVPLHVIIITEIWNHE